MYAVILAGGKGTRLRPYTVTLPKPLVPVGEEPILSILLQKLKSDGVTGVTLAVNHMADVIMAYFKKGKKFGLDINYSFEDKPLSTVAPIKKIRNLPENFIVANGDVLTDINFKQLYDNHLRSGADLTVATYKRKVKVDFGVLYIDEQNRNVMDFQEKPICDFEVSMGVYVFNRELLNIVPLNEPYGFDSLMKDMLKYKKKINTYPHGGYWLDIGRPDDYEKANRDIMNLQKKGEN